MTKCYKLRYINKITLFFEFQKGGGSTPETPFPGWTTVHNPSIWDSFLDLQLNWLDWQSNIFFPYFKE